MELLVSRLGPDDTFDLMNEALRRIEAVTRRLLVLSREGPLNPIAVDLDVLVGDTLKFLPSAAQSRAIRVVTALGGVGPVELDRDRVAEAIINLVDNAVDASPDGGEVTVRTDAVGEEVSIIVEDHGPGMNEEVRAKVFHPFFTTKPVGRGTGLGLAITRRIVEDHGGTIEVVSEPGAGTAIALRLRRRIQERRETP